MKSPARSPRLKRLSIVAFTMIVVIIPFCLYYLFFVQSQKTYFTKRNFRVLADIGDQITSKIDSLGTSLINVARSVKQAPNQTDKEKGNKTPTPDSIRSTTRSGNR